MASAKQELTIEDKKESWFDLGLGAVVIGLELLFMIFFLWRFINGTHPALMFKSLDSLSYREAKLYWEKGYPLPEEKVDIFYQVVDSLSDDVQEEFSIPENRMKVYYLGKEGTYEEIFGPDSAACHNRASRSIYLNRVLMEDHYNNGDFAMILVHEYIHALQHAIPEYLEQYAQDTGWVREADDFYQSEESVNFSKVLSTYSLTNPREDMAETYMYSYLCGNNLGRLSETRMLYIDSFWAIPREEYCQNFN